ncbi:MAG: hypothetical protein KGN32_10785 [Burkholderiales bacterium]|nr:hypothetical protein [Burkholderiales bacterium]
MFKFIRSARAKQDSQFPDTAMAIASGSTLQANDVQRELVLIAYRDTMRMHGVPAQWLDCKVQTLVNGDGTERTQIQLIMNKWSGHVLRYAMALERQLVQCLDRYEANVDHSEYEWVWKFGAECDCPFPDMPAPEEWSQKKVANEVRRAGPAPASVPPVQHKPMPPTSSAAVPAAVADDKEFDLRDIFSDLKPEDLRKR